jgi:hypothetical protein
MKHIIKISISCLIALILIIGCSDEFLELKPIAQATDRSFYDNFENVDKTVTAAYGRLHFNELCYYTVLTGQASCDDMDVGGSDPSDGVNWKEISRFAHSSANPALEYPWGQYYKGIRLANTALQYLPEVYDKEPELVNQRVAEMKFLRSYYLFELLKLFGGVPIIDKVLSPEEFYLTRNSIAEVLHFIQKDLTEAIPDLKLRSQLGTTDLARASKGAGQALLARAYLYESSYAKYHTNEIFSGCEEKFNLALEQAENVISSSEYELIGINGERYQSYWGQQYNPVSGDSTIGGFRYIFSVQGDFSKENVFEVGNSADGRGWYQSTGNALIIFTSCRFTEANPNNWHGWGFNNPTKYLLDAFRNMDSRETDLSTENLEVLPNQYSDPRFTTTCGLAGDLMLTVEGLVNGGTPVWSPMILDNVPTSTAGRKYEEDPLAGRFHPNKVANENGESNWKLIRYADVILIAAEAAFESGNTARALELVNMVRTRARLSNNDPRSENQIYPKNLSSVLFGDIMHERRLEFAGEMSRFYDIVRWNKTNQFINGIERESNPGQTLQFEDKYWFLPIPETQIQLSKGTLVQYPGW